MLHLSPIYFRHEIYLSRDKLKVELILPDCSSLADSQERKSISQICERHIFLQTRVLKKNKKYLLLSMWFHFI